MTTPIPIGDDIQVNTYDDGVQRYPTVAALADGSFVVIWMSAGQDGSSFGIYGRRFAADGTPVGNEFKANTFTNNSQHEPAVAALAGGGFVVTWTSDFQSNSMDVYGQRYAANGTPSGGEFKVNTFGPAAQSLSSVAALADGGFVVTWQSASQDVQGLGVYGQRFSATGTPEGSEFKVNTYTTSDQRAPSVAALPGGGFVVIWTSDGQDGSNSGVYGQRFSAAGAPEGSEFKVNTHTSDNQDFSSVAALADGSFVVTWSSYLQDGNSSGVYGQRFAANGTPTGSEFRVNTETLSIQTYPSVVALADGGFLVSWSSHGQDGNLYGVYGQRYAADGRAVGSEFRINEMTAGQQMTDSAAPTVAALTDGTLAQVWSGPNAEGVFFRLIGVTGDSTPTIVSIGAGGALGGADSIVSGQSGDATVLGTADAKATISLKFGSTDLGTAEADDSGQWTYTLTPENLALIGQGSGKTISATASNSEGATSDPVTSAPFAVDTIAPAPVLSVDAITGDNVVNAAEAGGNVQVTGRVTGEFKAGDTVSLTINGAVSTGKVGSNGAFSIVVEGSALVADVDHTVAASITTIDAAGNSGTARAEKVYAVDTTLPVPALTIASISADNVVNAAEAGGNVLVSGLVTGEFRAGDTVSVTVNGVVSIGQVNAVGAFSIAVKGSDLAADADLTVTAGITTKDAAGNSGTATAEKAYAVDTTPPVSVLTIASIAADNVVNAAEAGGTVQVTGLVTGEFQAGDVVSVAINGVVSIGQVDALGAFSIAIKGSDLAADADHTVAAGITTRDAAGNSGIAAAAKAYGVDTTPPIPALTIASITADNVVNVAEAGGTVVVKGAVTGEFQAGDTVSVTVNGVVSTGKVDADGAFSIAVEGSDLASDADHKVTASITTIDAAGNSGTATAEKAYAVDTTVPVPVLTIGPITADNVLNAAEAGGVVLVVTGTVSGEFKAGDTVTLTVNDVASVGLVDAGGAFNINVKVSDLIIDADHSVAASITTIDAAGNSGIATAANAYGVDTAAPVPVLTIAAITPDSVVNAAEAGGTVLVTGTVAGEFKAGDSVTLTVNDVASVGVVDALGAFSIAVNGSDLAADADHSVAASITTIDAAGNSGIATAAKAYGVDTTAPVPVLTIAAITPDNVVNAAEAGGTVLVTGTVAGEFKAGDSVTLTVNDVASVGVVDALGAFSIAVNGSDLAADADHSVAASITTIDAAGNSGIATAAKAYGVDTAAPVPVLTIAAITPDNVVNAAEAGGTVLVTGLVTGEFKAGDSVTLTVNDVASVGVVDALGAFSIAVNGSDLAADADHSVAASITTIDAAGNSATATAEKAYAVDTIAPAPVLLVDAITADNVVNAAEAGFTVLVTGLVAGEFQVGDTVSVTINGVVSTGKAGVDGAFSIVVEGSDLAADADLTVTASITTIDAAGNSATATVEKAYGVDTTPPLPVLTIGSITADNVVNAAEAGVTVLVTGLVTGEFQAGDTVSVMINDVASTGQVGADGAFSIAVGGSDLAADDDLTVTASVTTKDAAGNSRTATMDRTYGVDTAAPMPVLTIASITPDNRVSETEAGGTVLVTGRVTGEFKAGDTVSVTVNRVVSTSQVGAGGAFSIAVDGSDLAADADHTVTASITTKDAAGNIGTAATAKAYGLDRAAPVPVLTIAAITPDNMVNAAEAGGTVLVTGLVTGKFNAGDTVSVTVNGVVSTGLVGAGGAFSIAVDGSDLAADADHTVTASITTEDAAGNIGTAAAAKAYGLDSAAPVPVLTIAAITPDNMVNAAEAGGTVLVTGLVTGEFNAGDTVSVTVNGVVSTGLVGAGGAFSIAVEGSDLAADADLTVTAGITTKDAAGNSGIATGAKAYGVDTTAPVPVLTIASVAADNVVNTAEAGGTVLVTGLVAGEFNAGDTVSVTVNGVVSTGQIGAGGAFSIAVDGSDLAADADHTVTASITTKDAAGNIGTAATAKAYGLDHAAPVPVLTIAAITPDNMVNAAEAGGTVLVTGLVTGEFNAGDTVSVTVNGVVSTGLVGAGGAFSIAVEGSDLAADADLTVTAGITTKDTAGNSGIATAERVYGLDTTAPVSALTIGTITADNVVSAAEAGGTVVVKGTVTGEFKVGDTISVTIDDVVSTGLVDALGVFSIAVKGSDLAADADHEVVVSIATIDVAGNRGTATAEKAYAVDTTAPVPVLTLDAIAADNVVNAAEAGGTVVVTGTVTGEFRAGDTVSVTVNGVVSAGQVDTLGVFSIAVEGNDLASDTGHKVAASITTIDGAGNSGIATAERTYGVDTTAPVPALMIGAITADNVLNASEAGGTVLVTGLVTGEFKVGDTVSVTINGAVSTGQVDALGAITIAVKGSDLAADADVMVTAWITTADSAGNSRTVTTAKAYGLDTVAPVPTLLIGAITADNVLNAVEAGGTVLVTGTVTGQFKAGDTVSVTVNNVVSAGQVDALGAFSIAVKGSDMAIDADHRVAASITTIDAAGNSGTALAEKAYGVDTTAPVPALAIDAVTADNMLTAAEAGGTVAVKGTVSGQFNAGDTVSLTVNGVVSTGQVDALGAFSMAVKGSDLAADADHSVDGKITTIDGAGNSGTALAEKAYGVDKTAPVPVLTIASITPDNVLNVAEAGGTVLLTGLVTGQFKAGDTVSLTVNDAVSTGQVDALGAFTIAVEGGDLASDADHSVDGRITTIDAAGNSGTATAAKAYEVASVLSISSLTAPAEGASSSTTFRFLLTLDRPCETTQTVDWSVTGSGDHTADSVDFGGGLPHGTVTFAAGETTQEVTILVSGDTTVERDEGFSIVLSNASPGLTVDGASASATILNDDLKAIDDAYIVLQGHSLEVEASNGLLRNDMVASTAHSDLVTGGSHGVLQIDADGGLTYAPSADFTGRDDFIYRATDDSGASDSATGSIFVIPVSTGAVPTLNFLALAPGEQIAATYIAFFGRAADAAGFEFWVDQLDNRLPVQGPTAALANIASSFGVSQEAAALHPFLANPFGASDSQIGAFLDTVYANLFNRSPDAEGLAYWTAQTKQTLQAGRFVGSVLFDIISGAQESAATKDVTTIMAKVVVSLAYVHEQQEHHTVWAPSDLAAATSLLAPVTADQQTLLVGLKNAADLIAAHA